MEENNILYGWIARNPSGEIFLFEECPSVSLNYAWKGRSIRIPYKCFPEVRWPDEPVKVKIMIQKELNS